jgi:ABC-type uncharacterized transport system substrate-binding protein
MRRIGLAVVLAFSLLLAPLAGEGQQPSTVWRIGFLPTGFPASIGPLLEGFKRGLREHGYVEGQNILLELRSGEAVAERLPVLAAELVRPKVDVIVAIPNPAVETARQATQTIPIVMPIGSDPVGVGFVASLARPGGNITGLSAYRPNSTVNGSSFSRKLSRRFPGWPCS